MTVNDYANLPLAKAWVNVTALLPQAVIGTPTTYNKTTDLKGTMCLAIPEGTYSVEVGLTGFLNVRYYPVRVTSRYPIKLQFRLPLGEVTEGGVTGEADVSGTLLFDGKPVEYANVCVLQKTSNAVVSCGRTNDFGEYALSFPPGSYTTEIRTAQGQVFRSNITISQPGTYRNRLAIPPRP